MFSIQFLNAYFRKYNNILKYSNPLEETAVLKKKSAFVLKVAVKRHRSARFPSTAEHRHVRAVLLYIAIQSVGMAISIPRGNEKSPFPS